MSRPLGSKTLRGKAHSVQPDRVIATLAAVARSIRDRRLEAGVSVTELAAKAHLHPRTIHDAEGAHGGRRSPSKITTLVRIAIALDISLYQLVA